MLGAKLVLFVKFQSLDFYGILTYDENEFLLNSRMTSSERSALDSCIFISDLASGSI